MNTQREHDDHVQIPATGEFSEQQHMGELALAFHELPGLDPVPAGTYTTYRQMRTDPTIALARAVVAGPIVSQPWSYVGDDASLVGMIRDQLEPMRLAMLRDGLRALDYGWAGWEKVFEVVAGRIRLMKLKPLVPDLTRILIERPSGRFAGFRQGSIVIPPEKCLLYTYDREGDQYYGRSRLENVRSVWGYWLQANEGAARYDRKVAGVMPVVHYPAGQSVDRHGRVRPNHELAAALLNAIAAGKGVAIQNELMRYLDDRDLGEVAGHTAWKIELLEDRGSRQPGFIDRLRYLDSLKFRGYLRPERSALEGQTGTRADAAVHGSVGLTDSMLVLRDMLNTFNWYVVDQLLALNAGRHSRGAVRIEIQANAPLG